MRKKIGFITAGQAAGNIGKLFEMQGYRVINFNTSPEDLDTLDAKYKYHISGGEGCNKDRRKAKQLLIADYDNIVAEIEAKLTAELYFIIYSTGGGTGSGVGPILSDMLIGEGKTVGNVIILPDGEKESPKAHINAYECFSELNSIPGLGACFILDNERAADKFTINQRFVKDFCAYLEVPERHRSAKGNIDKAEIMETLSAHGAAVVFSATEKESAKVIDNVHNNIFAPLENDRVVKYITASLNGNVRMEDLVTAVGMPLDTFATYNEEGTICCISGLSYPQNRLDHVYGRIDESREVVTNNLSSTEATLKKDANFLNDLLPPKRVDKSEKPQSKRAIMSKYL